MDTIGAEPAHIVTDAAGEIAIISRGARALLFACGAERGRSLIECFPEYRKAVLFDIDVARTGWPTERVVRGSGAAAGVAVRYRVSRLLPSGGLYWDFQPLHEDIRRSA